MVVPSVVPAVSVCCCRSLRVLAAVSEALVACVQYYDAHGDAGFEPFIRARLHQKADEVRALMKRDPY